MNTTWLLDKRRQWAETFMIGKDRYDVKATPSSNPGSRGYEITCFQLPDWRGSTAYAGPATPGNRVCDVALQQGLADWPRGEKWGAVPSDPHPLTQEGR